MEHDLNSNRTIDFSGNLSTFSGEKKLSTFTYPDIINSQEVNKPHVIILTSEGGSGHKEAMQDSKAYYEKHGIPVKIIYVLPSGNNPTASWMKILSLDVGKFGVHYWNSAQIAGNMEKVQKISKQQSWVEWIFEDQFEQKMFNLLSKYPGTEQVIDTQAINTHKIIKAIAKFNKIRMNPIANSQYNKLVQFNNTLRKYPLLHWFASKRYKHSISYDPISNPIQYLKRMTDLPNRAEHFFNSLRKIRTKDLHFFSLEAPRAPQVDAKNYEENLAYYRSKCSKLWNRRGEKRFNQIIFTNGPIKKPFLDLKAWLSNEGNSLKNQPLHLEIKASSNQELAILRELTALEFYNHRENNQASYCQMQIPKNITVKCIMLGSLAIKESTLSYVESEIENHIKTAQNKTYFFVFCGRNDTKSTLYAELINRLQQNDIPNTLTIIPLSYQEASTIATLYARCDYVILRAGGISCMEIEATSTGMVYFHAEGNKTDLTETQLKKSMLYWEIGNYEHVRDTLGKDKVQLINPRIYSTKILNINARYKLKLT